MGLTVWKLKNWIRPKWYFPLFQYILPKIMKKDKTVLEHMLNRLSSFKETGKFGFSFLHGTNSSAPWSWAWDIHNVSPGFSFLQGADSLAPWSCAWDMRIVSPGFSFLQGTNSSAPWSCAWDIHNLSLGFSFLQGTNSSVPWLCA